MNRTFLTFSLLVAGTSVLLGSSDAEARYRCRGRGQAYQTGYYQSAAGCNTCGVAGATTTDAYGNVNTNAAAPANPAPAPPQETSPAQAPAAPAPGT